MSKFIQLVAAVLVIACVVVAINERTFLMRYFTYSGDPLALPLSWYSPLEPVPGRQDDSLPVADSAQRTIPRGALDAAAAYADAQGSQALIVVHRGIIQLEKYWHGADRETRFNPQSMSKSILGMLVGVSIEEGHIDSPANPVGRYVEEWRNDPRGAITIEQALQMTGGLEQMSESYDLGFLTRGARYSFGDDFNSMLLDLKQVDPPGAKFEYNNEEANLLGLVVERATGRRYADYLSEKIWQPLGLATADLYLDRPAGSVMKHCCILSRPYDWAKIGIMLQKLGAFEGVQIVPEDWVRKMITPSDLANFYGYQVWLGSDYITPGAGRKGPGESIIAPDTYLADDMIVLLGFGDQRVWISPVHELVIVRATMQWAMEWNETKIPNILLEALQNESKP